MREEEARERRIIAMTKNSATRSMNDAQFKTAHSSSPKSASAVEHPKQFAPSKSGAALPSSNHDDKHAAYQHEGRDETNPAQISERALVVRDGNASKNQQDANQRVPLNIGCDNFCLDIPTKCHEWTMMPTNVEKYDDENKKTTPKASKNKSQSRKRGGQFFSRDLPKNNTERSSGDSASVSTAGSLNILYKNAAEAVASGMAKVHDVFTKLVIETSDPESGDNPSINYTLTDYDQQTCTTREGRNEYTTDDNTTIQESIVGARRSRNSMFLVEPTTTYDDTVTLDEAPRNIFLVPDKGIDINQSLDWNRIVVQHTQAERNSGSSDEDGNTVATSGSSDVMQNDVPTTQPMEDVHKNTTDTAEDDDDDSDSSNDVTLNAHLSPPQTESVQEEQQMSVDVQGIAPSQPSTATAMPAHSLMRELSDTSTVEQVAGVQTNENLQQQRSEHETENLQEQAKPQPTEQEEHLQTNDQSEHQQELLQTQQAEDEAVLQGEYLEEEEPVVTESEDVVTSEFLRLKNERSVEETEQIKVNEPSATSSPSPETVVVDLCAEVSMVDEIEGTSPEQTLEVEQHSLEVQDRLSPVNANLESHMRSEIEEVGACDSASLENLRSLQEVVYIDIFGSNNSDDAGDLDQIEPPKQRSMRMKSVIDMTDAEETGAGGARGYTRDQQTSPIEAKTSEEVEEDNTPILQKTTRSNSSNNNNSNNLKMERKADIEKADQEKTRQIKNVPAKSELVDVKEEKTIDLTDRLFLEQLVLGSFKAPPKPVGYGRSTLVGYTAATPPAERVVIDLTMYEENDESEG